MQRRSPCSFRPLSGDIHWAFSQERMGILRCACCLAVGSVPIAAYVEGATSSSLLGALFRPLDALNLQSALGPSPSLLRGDRPPAVAEPRPFLPMQGDMSLLDSANTLELLTSLRQPRQPLTEYLQWRTTGFSSRKFTIVSALFGDEAADQRLKDAFGPVIEHESTCSPHNPC